MKKLFGGLPLLLCLSLLVSASAAGAGLPPQGVFVQGCPIDSMLTTCNTQLADISNAGLSITVTSLPSSPSTDTNTASYLQALTTNHLQAMWELDDTGWWGNNGSAPWGYNPNGSNMLSDYPAYTAACSCTTNDQLLQYIVTTLTGNGATWGWYIADDSQFAGVGSAVYEEQVAGLQAFGARLKQLAPATNTVIADWGNGGTGQLQNSHGVADFTAHELYPIFSWADTDPLTGSVAGAANFANAGAVQQLMDSYQLPSALILQAFDWGMDDWDAGASGDNPSIDAYPTAAQLLAMRNAALMASDPQLILWFYWNDTAGWPAGTLPAGFRAPTDPASRVAGLTAAVTAPLPASNASLSASPSTAPAGTSITVNAQANLLGGVTSLNLDPGTGSFSPMSSGTTSLTFSTPGVYVLRLLAYGRLANRAATTTITVTPATVFPVTPTPPVIFPILPTPPTLSVPQIAHFKIRLTGNHRQTLLFTYDLNGKAHMTLYVRHQVGAVYKPLLVRTFAGKHGHDTYTLSLAHRLPRGRYHIILIASNASGAGRPQEIYFKNY